MTFVFEVLERNELELVLSQNPKQDFHVYCTQVFIPQFRRACFIEQDRAIMDMCQMIVMSHNVENCISSIQKENGSKNYVLCLGNRQAVVSQLPVSMTSYTTLIELQSSAGAAHARTYNSFCEWVHNCLQLEDHACHELNSSSYHDLIREKAREITVQTAFSSIMPASIYFPQILLEIESPKNRTLILEKFLWKTLLVEQIIGKPV